MATMGTKLTLLLAMFMAASNLLAAAQPDSPDKPDCNEPTVTISNPSTLALDIMVDDKNVRVTTESATLVINHEEQRLQFSAGGGEEKEVTVHVGDVIMVIPDPADVGNPQAFKLVVGASYNIPIPEVPLPNMRPDDLPYANEPWPEMRP